MPNLQSYRQAFYGASKQQEQNNTEKWGKTLYVIMDLQDKSLILVRPKVESDVIHPELGKLMTHNNKFWISRKSVFQLIYSEALRTQAAFQNQNYSQTHIH